MFYQFDHKFNLTIVGDTKIKIKKNSNIKFLYFFNNLKDLITQYDLCDIFILPSYTEAHPKVIDEALARLRPVIIFDDIEHVVENRKGVFITKRNVKDFTITVKYINNNYKKIVNDIRKNKLPTKKKFIEDLTKILQLH